MLIALYSSTPGCGKSTIAEHLGRQGFTRVSFADPLRAVTRTFLTEYGFDLPRINRLLTDGKNDRIPELGVTPRHLLQTLGTEWGRGCIDPNVWTRIWRSKVRSALAAGHSVVADDLRFHEEYECVRSLGGRIWRVTRPGNRSAATHASDSVLCDRRFDAVFVNNGTFEELHRSIQYSLPQVQQLTP